jgi:hypothetical protein
VARTISTLFGEARTLLQDKGVVGGVRVSDAELMEAFNAGLVEARARRPDAFLALGLRNPTPYFDASVDLSVVWPFEEWLYTALTFYVAGKTEMRDDTFADDNRAASFMNMFISKMLVLTA